MYLIIYWAIAILVLVLIYRHLKKRNEYFKHRNIPGPEPQMIFGNLLQMISKPCMHDAIQEWTQKYGKVFGYFEGGTPVLVMSDPDMVHDVLVKKFSSFNARKALPIQPDPETSKNIHMFLARGLRWKRLRAISNPTFSAAKLKQMSSPMEDAIQCTMKQIEVFVNKNEPFDIYLLYQSLTLDIISRCAFSFVSDGDDEFLSLCKKVFEDTVKLSPIAYVSIFFPELAPLWRQLSFATDRIRQNPFIFLEDKLKKMLEMRKKHQNSSSSKPNDLLQLLLDSEASDFSFETGSTTTGTSNGGTNEPLKLSKKMHPEEIISTMILFMLAGYETTSTALAYTTYLLATHPEVQEKLQLEIDGLNVDSIASMETIVKNSYLDNVISETLRLYPIAQPVEARICLQTCSVGGVTIEKGSTISVDVWTIHNDPTIWGTDVKQFKPERFSPEESENRHPMAWLPFGAGPRNCIGMRFALMEAKLSLARLLRAYTIKTCPMTEIPLQLCEGATCTPKHGVYVILEKRNL